jgi:pimeloyl-ACP methyl ester carboxylesterase
MHTFFLVHWIAAGYRSEMLPLRRTLTAVLLTVATAVLATPALASAAGPKVMEKPVAFTVTNVNQSLLPCTTDGGTYTIVGHLNGTAQELSSGKVTLLLHGLGLGEFFWRIQIPGYDFAKNLAGDGHASVTIDRLGYGASGKPVGTGSCIGGQATIAHEIIGDLKTGNYTGAGSPSFAKVGLIGHSAGGQITEVESYSFHDAQAIGVLGYADQGFSAYQLSLAKVAAAGCAQGGTLQDLTFGPAGYESLGSNLDQAYDAFFHSAPSGVVAAALPHLSSNPCGDLSSYAAAPSVDMTHLASITQPVLLVQGGKDALFPPPDLEDQAKLFTGSSSVSYSDLPDAGHAFTYEAGHQKLATTVAAFLASHGL